MQLYIFWLKPPLLSFLCCFWYYLSSFWKCLWWDDPEDLTRSELVLAVHLSKNWKKWKWRTKPCLVGRMSGLCAARPPMVPPLLHRPGVVVETSRSCFLHLRVWLISSSVFFVPKDNVKDIYCTCYWIDLYASVE